MMTIEVRTRRMVGESSKLQRDEIGGLARSRRTADFVLSPYLLPPYLLPPNSILPVYSAIPTTASTPIASSAFTSSIVVIPPAAVTAHIVVRRISEMSAQIRTLHEPLAVHVGEQVFAHERVERLHGFSRAVGQLGAPAVDDDFSAAAIDGGDQTAGADRLGEKSDEGDVHAAIGEERQSGDYGGGAKAKQLTCALDTADAASNAAWELAADSGNELRVVASALGRIEIDQLNLRLSAQLENPGVDVARFDGEPFALDELHDASALKVDGWDQHGSRSDEPNRYTAGVKKGF